MPSVLWRFSYVASYRILSTEPIATSSNTFLLILLIIFFFIIMYTFFFAACCIEAISQVYVVLVKLPFYLVQRSLKLHLLNGIFLSYYLVRVDANVTAFLF